LIHVTPAAVTAWGSEAVFVNVLLTRLGVPVPAVPVLVFAGSAVAHGTLSFPHVLLAAVFGALIGDGVWFSAGRRYGRPLINRLARFSLSIDTSVQTTRSLFERFGAPIVSVCKFVPGLALITPPLMGTTRIATSVFVTWDAVGAVAWAGFWLLGGSLFSRQLAMLLRTVERHGATVFDLLAALALLYLAYRYLRRWRLRKWLQDLTISAEQLDVMMHSAVPPVVLDARLATAVSQEPYRIPGALLLDPDTPRALGSAFAQREVVVYCVCPNDISAKRVCQRLRGEGFEHAHTLGGGLDAWVARGYPVEPVPAQAEPFGQSFARQ
jgi:membrane protein DedA with SNARE-associated domain/rhodanese-related sulfurtransferase